MTQHEVKTYRADIKAIGGTKAQPSGVFEALVAVFGNVDYGADRIVPGAFAESLAEWKAKGDPIPVIWSHEWDDPTSHIGVVTQATETADGLLVRAELDVKNNPKAAYIARLLADRRVTQFSFGYIAKEWDFVQDPDYGQVRELKVVDLFEVGPTLRGMNPSTQLLEAASALHPSNATQVTGKADDLIRAAHEALTQVLATVQADVVVEDAVEAVVEAAVEPIVEQTTTPDVPDTTEVTGDTPTTIDPERFAELLVLSQD